MTIITEDIEVNYKEYSELSFYDSGGDNVMLYINDEYEGDCEVWTDRDNDNREYIILNNTMLYLDELTWRT